MRQPNGKFRYNCTIMDLFDRSAIASVNSDYINTELAIETLTKALKKKNQAMEYFCTAIREYNIHLGSLSIFARITA